MKNILNTTGHELLFKNIVRAENCSVFDSHGNRYLDLESGIWCMPLGHCHPDITKIISEQAGKIIHTGYCYLDPVIDQTAGKILEITKLNSGKCVFLSSGSEAVEFSVKLAKSISNKPYLLTMKNCYLSAFGTTGERCSKQWINFDWMNGQKIDEIDFGKISAFVFEPGSSMGLVGFPPNELISEITSKVRENGGMVIANEVTTGIGRTGYWFGCEHYGIVPDIVAMGKGLGNGYPVSSVAISDEIIKRIDLKSFHHSQSHQNDPLGAAVAGKVIEVIENEDLLSRSRSIGKKIKDEIDVIKFRHGKIKEVRGRGLMIAVEFEERHFYANHVFEKLIEKKIILVKRPDFEVLRLDPALTITLDDVDFFLQSMDEALTVI
ncbi:aspartate aminotransferase family protein [candidate division WOR-3 bacterium]|nr:aspartate aminotransferase family protein [candidate division WOR-3 bacterium]